MIIKIPKEKKPVTSLTAQQEALLDRKMDERFRSQRELKSGRNFLWNTFRFKLERDIGNYRDNFDKIKWKTRPPGHGI